MIGPASDAAKRMMEAVLREAIKKEIRVGEVEKRGEDRERRKGGFERER